MQEIELVQRAQKGDRKALKELLQMNYSILKGYLLKITLDPDLAADLTQETMLKAILKLQKFKGQSKFSTWLITIGSNLYRDYLKKNRHLIMVDYPERFESITEMKEAGLIIEEMLLKLPAEKRMVLVLKHYFGYTYEEISKIIKCPVGTVKSRMYYCLEFLQNQIERGNKG
ncbi:RNA polymerase sigma factor SigY [Anoxybacter fermentans]|uniref:RNA polymerase sigma factor SigY n=1 Tax=Anoxybacter fermentans TaxID=1323375 RepID=A0A3S9SUV5_9FIRM|nr:sigma-70 family RNA polymerase sigma factor [Anoxybacter fermentans]AZR72097.1 RNA polymerase sigma factor SigY [Anoxybacter fermentans]